MLKSTATTQYLAAICVNLISISYGASAGWPSSSFLILKSEYETPLPCGALSTEELSWIGSLLGIGGLIGSIVFGWLSDTTGRKTSLCLIAFPAILGWLLIIFARNANFLYLSRLLSGMSAGGSFVLVPLFISEIAEDEIRGSLGSLMMMSANFGILLAFVAGNYLTYEMIPRVFIVLPVIYFLALLLIPETPTYYMKINREEKAIKSLEFYRNVKTDRDRSNRKFENQIDRLKTNDNTSSSQIISVSMASTTTLNQEDNEIPVVLTIYDFTNKAARKAFFIGFFLMFLHEFCGCFTMINYTATIFEESGSSISPTISAIIVAIIQLVGTFVSTKLVDGITGRKNSPLVTKRLLLISSIGSALSLLTLGTYSLLNKLEYEVKPYSWVAIVSFSSMLFLASCGIIPLPFVVLAEIMPEKIRSIGAIVCLCFSWIMVFAMVKLFPTLVGMIGLYGCIYVFAGCCLIGVLFIIFLLPETKGKSYEEIFQDLNN